jgi:hypothetical protein
MPSLRPADANEESLRNDRCKDASRERSSADPGNAWRCARRRGEHAFRASCAAPNKTRANRSVGEPRSGPALPPRDRSAWASQRDTLLAPTTPVGQPTPSPRNGQRRAFPRLPSACSGPLWPEGYEWRNSSPPSCASPRLIISPALSRGKSRQGSSTSRQPECMARQPACTSPDGHLEVRMSAR